MKQPDLFASGLPHSRTSDPWTSHAAGREETRSGRRDRQADAVVAWLRLYPDRTATELSRIMNHDVHRRVSECAALGRITCSGARKCGVTRRHAQTWRAS